MSKQTGIIKIKGKLGGISFYQRGDKDLARISKSPDKSRIATDPAFERTRENNMEFAGAAMSAKAFRLSLGSTIKRMAGKLLVQRTTKLFKEINRRGTGLRGQRTIRLSENKDMLVGLELNNTPLFSNTFHAEYSVSPAVSRSEATVNISGFIPRNEIVAPEAATHFKMVAILGLVANYEFDSTANCYAPVDADLNAKGTLTESSVTPLAGSVPVSFQMTVSFPGSPTLPAGVSSVICLGIEFYQQIGSDNYLLSQGNCMKVIAVV